MLGWLHSLRDVRAAALAASGLLALAAIIWGTILFRENLTLRRQFEASKLGTLDPQFAPVWGQFFAPGARNVVVFGSPIFFASESEGFFLRWAGLNRASDFQNEPTFQRMQGRFGPLSGPRYDYSLTGDAVALQRLTAFFGGAGGTLIALPAHRATWEDIRDGNVIFLGAPRMIPFIERLPVQQDFEWDADHNVVNRNPGPGEQEKYVTPSHWEELSYAVVACFPGLRPNRQILLLTAHSAPGTLAAVEHLTRPDSVRQLIQRLGTGDPIRTAHFQMLLRVVVDEGNPVKTEYVTHHVVPSTPASPLR